MNKRVSKTIVSLLLLLHSIAWGEAVKMVSPDKKITFNIAIDNGIFNGRLSTEENAVILDIPMSITIDGVEYPGGSPIEKLEQYNKDASITATISTIKKRSKDVWNETLIQLEAPVALRVRVSNEGVAFRWESQIAEDEVIINEEKLSFKFAADYTAYYPIPNGEGFFSSQENIFRQLHLSEIKEEGLKVASVPLLVELGGNRNLLLTDVNVEGYPGLWVNSIGGTEIVAEFPHYPEEEVLEKDRYLKVLSYRDYLAKTRGTRTYPWRALMITDDAGLLTATMLYSLAEPCRLDDTSWIKPGKVAWDWWNAWNITDVPFEAGINQETYQDYIDFAHDNELEYVIIDEAWSVKGPDNLLEVVSGLDIAKLVEYGRTKNVGVILWMTAVALQRNFERAFEQFSKWGIKGIKVDFIQRDDQLMMDFCYKVAAKAAEHQLIVDFHGGSKPTGLHRTYPNVLTHESVPGLEQSKWGRKASPEMSVLLPFIRMAVGPMDYTPGAMDNFSKETFRIDFKNPGSQGTRCHQLAMYVVYLSPLQMLADTPTKYRKNPECMAFLRAVPTVWEDTVVLEAKLGATLALARRKGDTWFLGALSDWTPRELSCRLDFLPRGKYHLRFWADGPKAAESGTNFIEGEATVTRETELKLMLASGGGYVAILEPYSDEFVRSME